MRRIYWLLNGNAFRRKALNTLLFDKRHKKCIRRTMASSSSLPPEQLKTMPEPAVKNPPDPYEPTTWNHEFDQNDGVPPPKAFRDTGEGPLGPIQDPKKTEYHNLEYYSYHRYSYYDILANIQELIKNPPQPKEGGTDKKCEIEEPKEKPCNVPPPKPVNETPKEKPCDPPTPKPPCQTPEPKPTKQIIEEKPCNIAPSVPVNKVPKEMPCKVPASKPVSEAPKEEPCGITPTQPKSEAPKTKACEMTPKSDICLVSSSKQVNDFCKEIPCEGISPVARHKPSHVTPFKQMLKSDCPKERKKIPYLDPAAIEVKEDGVSDDINSIVDKTGRLCNDDDCPGSHNVNKNKDPDAIVVPNKSKELMNYKTEMFDPKQLNSKVTDATEMTETTRFSNPICKYTYSIIKQIIRKRFR